MGGGGPDTLERGTGNDILNGGFGPDTYVFDNNHGFDQIIGWEDNFDDIEFSAYFRPGVASETGSNVRE